jgi:hypothetical protein
MCISYAITCDGYWLLWTRTIPICLYLFLFWINRKKLSLPAMKSIIIVSDSWFLQRSCSTIVWRMDGSLSVTFCRLKLAPISHFLEQTRRALFKLKLLLPILCPGCSLSWSSWRYCFFWRGGAITVVPQWLNIKRFLEGTNQVKLSLLRHMGIPTSHYVKSWWHTTTLSGCLTVPR